MKKIENCRSHKEVITIAVLLCLFTCLSPIAVAQRGTASGPTCSVEIVSIKDGDKVGPSVTVRGKASIPADGYLWILSRKKSMGNQWWPQAGGPVEIDKNGDWEGEVFFGRPEDVASNFDVAAAVLNRQTNGELIKWFSTAKEMDYPPIPFPDSNSACSIATIKVIKTR